MNRSDTLKLIDAYFDDDLSNAEFSLFEEMLDENQEFLAMFMRESRFHLRLSAGVAMFSQSEFAISNLDEAVMLDQQLNQTPPLASLCGSGNSLGEMLRVAIMDIISSARFLWAIMLFSMGLFLLMMFMLIPRETALDNPNPFAKVTHVSQTVDAVWGKDIEEESLKVLFKGTKLDLKSGLAQVEYKNGVRVNLEGPTVFVISGDNEGTLLSGKVSGQMAKQAKKFAVTTPVGKITDLGTEFGIIVDQNQNTDVQVFDGKVKLAIFGKKENSLPIQAVELVETDAVRIDSGKRTISKIPYTPLRFARSYEDLRPYYYDDFSTDSSDNYATSLTQKEDAFSIENGVLLVRGNSEACTVISKRPLLGSGEVFMVDVPGIDPKVSEVSIVVSTQDQKPVLGTEVSGFCFRRQRGLVVSQFSSSEIPPENNPTHGVEKIRVDDPLFGEPIRLVIERRTETDFVFYYESNDGRTRIAKSISNPDLKNLNRLYVGVEVRSTDPKEIKIFDNFIVYPVEQP